MVVGNPIKFFFQEVVEGDVRKVNKESNDSQTGGGARDLRISPAAEFWEGLLDFFPQEASVRERSGQVVTTGSILSTKVTLMGPTKSRRNECRICKIWTIPNWRITNEQFELEKSKGLTRFYILTLDSNGKVWADTFLSSSIESFEPSVRLKIQKRIKECKKTIRGIIII